MSDEPFDFLARATLGDFKPHVGSRFRLESPGNEDASIYLTLVEARDLQVRETPGESDPKPRRQFSLLFHGPGDPLLPQGTYWLQHDALPRLPLFLVPLGSDAGASRYQAAFT